MPLTLYPPLDCMLQEENHACCAARSVDSASQHLPAPSRHSSPICERSTARPAQVIRDQVHAFELEPLPGIVKVPIKDLIWECTHLNKWLEAGKHLLKPDANETCRVVFVLTTQG